MSRKAQRLVSELRTALTAVFSSEETLADAIFGDSARDEAGQRASQLIKELHAEIRSAWAKAEGARAETLWVAKAKVEAMLNKVSLGKTLDSTFLADLGPIEAILKVSK